MTDNTIALEKEYRSIRQELANAGLLLDNVDALYAEWQRWRKAWRSPVSQRRLDAQFDANEWLSGHLSQFRRLMDPAHVAARAVRARKDAKSD